MDVTDDSKWNLLRLRVHERDISLAFHILRAGGIEPILFKGWAVAMLYPLNAARGFADIDLAVSPSDFAKAAAICESNAGRINIDLHKGFRHLDRRPWEKLLTASTTLEINNTTIRIPAPEDHLRLLCAHWLNDGGVDRDRLWDIYYSVEKRPVSFDWDKCLNAAGPERRSWVVYTIAMAHEYLGLPIDDLPMRNELRRFPEWMRETVEKEWASGVRLRDLRTCLGDWNLLRTQIGKRIPPNPIQATIEMEKSLDDPRRRYFQARTVIRRAVCSASKLRHRFSK